MKRIDTPWGPSQHQREHAEGIVFHSTASHGGYHLSPQRQIELHEIVAFKAFGPCWLEEDCEAAIVALRWPAYATDEQIADAISMARTVASWSHSSARWQPVVDWLDTSSFVASTMLHERAERHIEATKQLWSVGGMSTSGGNWEVHFRRGNETRFVSMDYPTKRYYSDEELAQLEATARCSAERALPTPDEDEEQEVCPQCGHSETSDGYGGNNCPDCWAEKGAVVVMQVKVAAPVIQAIDRTTKDGSCTLVGFFSDNAERKLFSFYIDELSFADSELIGLTEEQAHQLRTQRDVEYLRS